MTFIIPDTVLYAGALDSATLGIAVDYQEKITVPTDKIRSVKFSTTPFDGDVGEIIHAHLGAGIAPSYNAWISKDNPGDPPIYGNSLVQNRSGYFVIEYDQRGEVGFDTRIAKLNTSTDYFINIEKFDDEVGVPELMLTIETTPNTATSGSGSIIPAPAPTPEVPNPPPVYSSTPQFQYPPEWNDTPIVIDDALILPSAYPGSVNGKFPNPTCGFGSSAVPALGMCFHPANGYSISFFDTPTWAGIPNEIDFIFVRPDQVLSMPITMPNYTDYFATMQFIVPTGVTTSQAVLWFSRDPGMEAIDGVVTTPAVEGFFLDYTTSKEIFDKSAEGRTTPKIPLLDAGGSYHLNIAYATKQSIDIDDPNAYTFVDYTVRGKVAGQREVYTGRREVRLGRVDYKRGNIAKEPWNGRLQSNISARYFGRPPPRANYYNGVLKRSLYHRQWFGHDQPFFGVQNAP